MILIYPIYNQNWRNNNTIYIYIYITILASNEIFSPSNKIHRELGQARNLSAPLYIYRCSRRNVPEFGRVFLMLKYTDITQNMCPKLNGYGDNGQRSLKL